MGLVFIDCETCGLHGVPVIIQYAIDDNPIQIHNFWTENVGDSLDLINMILLHNFVGFNLAFDFFHIYKMWTMLSLYLEKGGSRTDYPDLHIDQFGMIEEQARFYDFCIKPITACDLMLLGRRDKWQALMSRDPIRIKRVPTQLAWLLAEELERTVQFDDIFFAKSKKSGPKWKVFDIEGQSLFKEVRLHFKASGSLKAIYKHVFNEEVTNYKEIEIDKKLYPKEVGYAPFAKALAPNAPADWGNTWPDVIKFHINHWTLSAKALEYASDDVKYTRRLYKEFFGSPKPGDVDSTLACMVACCRWSGYAINKEMLQDLKEIALLKLKFPSGIAKAYKNRPITKEIVTKYSQAVMAPRAVIKYLTAVMAPEEKLTFIQNNSSKKTLLEDIVKHFTNDDGTLESAAVRAKEVLDARAARKEIEVYDKLLLAGRFHASFKVIGALSSRMSGADGLNPHGIDHESDVREAFTLADEDKGFTLSIGDFKSFEVSIAATVFNDEVLYKDLTTPGVKIHALFGTKLFPHLTYQEIMDSDGKNPDWYNKGKQGIFSIFYGGEEYTLMTRLGVSEENAKSAYSYLKARYIGIAKFGAEIKNDFEAITQPKGIGTAVEWKTPKNYAESFLGFKRFFTLENRVMKALFDLARKVPANWRKINIQVVRRERIQTGTGAVSSALYGAAFGIQSRNIRAAKNHKIQSPGAEITKKGQFEIWQLQPTGIHKWIVKPMNVHDEIAVPVRRGYESQVKAKIDKTVSDYKSLVPLLVIDWVTGCPNWAEKKGVLH